MKILRGSGDEPPIPRRWLVRLSCVAESGVSICLLSNSALPALSLDPSENFVLLKTPIFPDSEAWDTINRTSPSATINPRNRDPQKLGDLFDSE
jgi:hypothetical protein